MDTIGERTAASRAGDVPPNRPAFGFQGHPEASPGPHDLKPLFERFNHLMLRRLQMQLKLAEENARK